MSIFLAIDLGTTGCRSILFDEKLRQLANSYEEYGLITPSPEIVEQDANLWWDLTLRTARAAIAQAGIDGQEIDGISISSQGITLVPVDEDCRPLCNAITWLDTRTAKQVEEIRSRFGDEEIFLRTGRPNLPVYTLQKILWLQRHRPEIIAKAHKLLLPMDFLIAKLTGKYVTDHSMASGTLLYDLRKGCWDKELLDFCGIDASILPDLAYSGEVAGTVLPEVAKALGLREDCVVAVGAQDQKCAAYGAGLNDEMMTVSLGTAAAVTRLQKTAKTEENRGVCWCGYVEKDAFVIEGVVNTAGTCLRYVRDLFFGGENYDVINAEAKEALNRGSRLVFHPYLNGDNNTGIGNFYGITLATTRGDYALAVMEGVAFQLRVLLETMEYDKTSQQVILFGGAAKSALWSQIIANALGTAVCVLQTSEAAGAGAARLAAKAAGAPTPPLTVAKTYTPENTAEYDKKYAKYLEIQGKLWHPFSERR